MYIKLSIMSVSGFISFYANNLKELSRRICGKQGKKDLKDEQDAVLG